MCLTKTLPDRVLKENLEQTHNHTDKNKEKKSIHLRELRKKEISRSKIIRRFTK